MLVLKLGFLLPKGWAGAMTLTGCVTALAADIHFSDTVTVGSIIVAAIVIVLSGLFTLRNNLRSFWHDLAEERLAEIDALKTHLAEREAEIERDREAARDELAKHTEEQKTLRHELKSEIAALTLNLQAERAKTDLSALMEQLGRQHAEAMDRASVAIEKQQEILDMLVNGDNRGR